MKLSNLLSSRQALQRQVYLANLAYGYRTLSELVRRIERARLRGPVQLSPAKVEEERYWPALISLDGRQSVIEEHFDDDDILLLSDGIAFGLEGDFSELQFDLSEVSSRFVAPLRRALEQAGVEFDADGNEVTSRGDSGQDALR